MKKNFQFIVQGRVVEVNATSEEIGDLLLRLARWQADAIDCTAENRCSDCLREMESHSGE